MTRADVRNLAIVAQRADRLQKCIDAADAVIRSWTRGKGAKREGLAVVSIYQDGDSWRRIPQLEMPVEFVYDELVPVLKRIREEAAARLAALDMPAKGEGKT